MIPGGKQELLAGLARLVRGLSCLFWGLPASLILYVQTARMDWMDRFGPLSSGPAFLAGCLILYGLIQMQSFQKQERVWQSAVERCKILMLMNVALAPFLYWWKRMPDVTLYSICVTLLCATSLIFLLACNQLLVRLSMMLPDEPLRLETKLFTNFNTGLLTVIGILAITLSVFDRMTTIPVGLIEVIERIKMASSWMLTGFILLPMALTMALTWKIKEVVFHSVFYWDYREPSKD